MTDFKATMHQIRFRLGLRPRPPAGGAYSAPQTPSWIWGRGGAGLGKRRGREGRETEGPQVTVELGPLRALLRH